MQSKGKHPFLIRSENRDDFMFIIDKKLKSIQNHDEPEIDNETMHLYSMKDSCEKAYGKDYIEIRAMDEYYCLKLLEEAQAHQDDLGCIAEHIYSEIIR